MSVSQPKLDDLRIEREGKPGSHRRTVPVASVVFILAIVAAAIWWMLRPKAPEVRTAVVREVTSSPSIWLAGLKQM